MPRSDSRTMAAGSTTITPSNSRPFVSATPSTATSPSNGEERSPTVASGNAAANSRARSSAWLPGAMTATRPSSMAASSRRTASATAATTSPGEACTTHGGTPSSRIQRGGATPGAAVGQQLRIDRHVEPQALEDGPGEARAPSPPAGPAAGRALGPPERHAEELGRLVQERDVLHRPVDGGQVTRSLPVQRLPLV